ncbi:hypothetical protein AYO44_13890 [Planctomycetaceae bacterium SCGC AG-212-F19]|nr:hypothetical protein AYO44_13890 [Planctomycetaceae bacterium SCGC AG-212-F19]
MIPSRQDSPPAPCISPQHALAEIASNESKIWYTTTEVPQLVHRIEYPVPEPSFRDLLKRIAEAVERAAGHLQALDRQGSLAAGRADAEFISIKQAAGVAGLSATKIRREIKAGRLPASDVGTPRRSHYRIRKTDLQIWLETNKGGIGLPPKSELASLVNRYFPDV